MCLTTEAVQGAALALEGVNDVKGGHGLSAGVLSVGHGVSDDVLKEDLEDTTGLLVDEAGDALNTATTSETADSGLRDALDVVTKDLSVALGTTLMEKKKKKKRREKRGGCGVSEEVDFAWRVFCMKSGKLYKRVSACRGIDLTLPNPFPPFPLPDMFISCWLLMWGLFTRRELRLLVQNRK